MILEIGTYSLPKEAGFKGWVAFDRTIAFERLDGEVVVLPKPTGS
jgi:hypothetical protein